MKAGNSNGHPLSRRFRHLLLQLAHQARNDLENIPRHPRRAVHALRIRMKKLPAIIRLVGSRIPGRSRKAVLGCAKQLRKAFTTMRDAQVAADLGFAATAPGTADSAVPMFDQIAKLIRLLEAESLDGLASDDIRDAYIATYRRGRKRMKDCLRDPDPARLHAWRKPVKELYYQSLALHRVRGMKRRLRRARKLGRWLGQDHDWQLIIEKQPEALKKIGPAREKLRRRIFKIAGRLYATSPKKLARQLA